MLVHISLKTVPIRESLRSCAFTHRNQLGTILNFMSILIWQTTKVVGLILVLMDDEITVGVG